MNTDDPFKPAQIPPMRHEHINTPTEPLTEVEEIEVSIAILENDIQHLKAGLKAARVTLVFIATIITFMAALALAVAVLS